MAAHPLAAPPSSPGEQMTTQAEIEAARRAFIHVIAEEIRAGNREWIVGPHLTDATKAALEAAARVRNHSERPPTQSEIEAACAAYEIEAEDVVYVNGIIAALEAAARSRWQPIETAPKDGDTNILVGCFGKEWHGEQFVVFYDEHPDRPKHPWQTPDGIAYHRDATTHWQPLPSPPESK